MALVLLPVASTRSSLFPEEYSASWMDSVSAATVGEEVRVAVGGAAVAVDVGSAAVEVGAALV